jgi:hypothetical protein
MCYLSVTYVFIKQIFRAADQAPPSPPPPQGCALCAGGGWGSAGCLHPIAGALVMAFKP